MTKSEEDGNPILAGVILLSGFLLLASCIVRDRTFEVSCESIQPDPAIVEVQVLCKFPFFLNQFVRDDSCYFDYRTVEVRVFTMQSEIVLHEDDVVILRPLSQFRVSESEIGPFGLGNIRDPNSTTIYSDLELVSGVVVMANGRAQTIEVQGLQGSEGIYHNCQ